MSKYPGARAIRWLVALTIWSSGCSDEIGTTTPADLRERLPKISALRPVAPTQDAGEETASGVVAARFRRLDAQLRALDLLDTYLTEGGDLDRGVALVIAVEDPPRVADQTKRYTRVDSRLDVEEVTDHRYYYLQVPAAGHYDPDNAISERAMLVDGSTIVPPTTGTRAPVSHATGLARAERGYLRVHLNRRAQDADPLSNAIQIDYDLNEQTQSLHLVFFDRSGTDTQELPRGFWSVRETESGQHFMLYSVALGQNLAYGWLAQQTAENRLVVWHGDGALWACYDSDGTELGNEAQPALCEDLSRPFPRPPTDAGVWPGLPGGVPRQ